MGSKKGKGVGLKKRPAKIRLKGGKIYSIRSRGEHLMAKKSRGPSGKK